MSNEYKRATGYYTLKSKSPVRVVPTILLINLLVFGVSGVGANVKDLYVKVGVKDTIQRTQVIRDESEPWNEILPM